MYKTSIYVHTIDSGIKKQQQAALVTLLNFLTSMCTMRTYTYRHTCIRLQRFGSVCRSLGGYYGAERWTSMNQGRNHLLCMRGEENIRCGSLTVYIYICVYRYRKVGRSEEGKGRDLRSSRYLLSRSLHLLLFTLYLIYTYSLVSHSSTDCQMRRRDRLASSDRPQQRLLCTLKHIRGYSSSTFFSLSLSFSLSHYIVEKCIQCSA